MVVSPNDEDIREALRQVLLGFLPQLGEANIILGQVNRTPEPTADDFIVFTEILRNRLSTNKTDNADVLFHGYIDGSRLAVSSVEYGSLRVGANIFGGGVSIPTVITSVVAAHNGGPGDYTVDPSQTVAQGALAAGSAGISQPVEILFQCDVHGPKSADNAQVITTLIRDAYGVDRFAEQNQNVIPLYADDPKQVPFDNGERQVEDRWIVEIRLQANQTVIIPQQFADALELEVVSVEAEFPASL